MRRGILWLVALMLGAQAAQAAVGEVAYVMGEVWIERHGEKMAAELGMPLERRDVVVTGEVGRAKLAMRDGTKIYVGARSRIEVAKYVARRSRLVAALNMFWGRARFFVHKVTGGEFSVRTTTAVLGVRGTSFLVMTPQPGNLNEIVQKGLHRDFARFSKAVKLPTRVVLHTGRLMVQTAQGARIELSPGRMADVSATGEVKVGRVQEKAPLPAPAPQPGAEGGAEKGKGKEKPAGRKGKPAEAREKERKPTGGEAPKKGGVQPPASGKERPAGGKGAKGPVSGGAPSAGGVVAPAPKAPAPPPPPAAQLGKAVKGKATRAPSPPPPVQQAPVQDVRNTVKNTKLELGPNTKITIHFKGFVQP